MTLLVFSLMALVAAPLVYRVAHRAATALAALDGFVMVAIAGIAAAHILPHAIEVAGMAVIAVALLGFLGPGWVEEALHRAAAQVHRATLILALSGLVLHSMVDGVGLAAPTGHSHNDSVLGLAVLLHRLPVAITLWWLIRPQSLRLAVGTMVAVAIATVIGYVGAEQLAPSLSSVPMAYLQALIIGSVLHVVVHRPAGAALPKSPEGRLWSGVGALIGLMLVVFLTEDSFTSLASAESEFARLFFTLALESAPALVLAFAMAGVVQALLPSFGLSWLQRGGSGAQAMRGVIFGLPLPICSCGVIPLYQSLIGQGVPAAAAMAFLVATPELGVDAVLLSLPLLGSEMTLYRVAAAVIVALLVGAVVGRMASKGHHHHHHHKEEHEALGRSSSMRERLVAGLRYGFVEVVDHTGPWIVFGLVIAALVGPVLDSPWIRDLPWGVDVFVFALIGMPTYVCASGATPFVAVFLLQGGSPGAALAFLLAGPATNVTTFGVLAQAHGRRIALAFALAILLLSVGLGLLINGVFGGGEGLNLPELHQEHASLLGIASLVVLAFLYLLSVLRQGPRGFMAQIHSPFQEDEGAHCHDHGHGHCH